MTVSKLWDLGESKNFKILDAARDLRYLLGNFVCSTVLGI